MGEFLNLWIDAAGKIANLGTTGILIAYLIYKEWMSYKKQDTDSKQSENWRVTREDAVRAEEQQTNALMATASQVSILGDSHNRLVERMEHLVTIVEERMPRR